MSLASNKVLVLNKGWNAVNIVTLEKALKKLTGTYRNGEPKAKIIDCLHDFRTMTWEDWRELIPDPHYCPECHKIMDNDQIKDGSCLVCGSKVGERGMKSVNAILRIPRVIQLTKYDRIRPQKVQYNRRTIYRRDNNTCFVGDTLILMADSSLKPISEVQVGDEVLDAYGNRQTVEYVHSRKAVPDEIISIKHRGNGDPLTCTVDHRILPFEWNGSCLCPDGVAAGQLGLDSYLSEIVPSLSDNGDEMIDLFDLAEGKLPHVKLVGDKIKHYCGNIVNRFVAIDNDLGRLCGYYLSEGSVVGGCVSFALNGQTESVYAEEIACLLKTIFGLESKWEVDGNRGKVICNSTVLALFFGEFFGKNDGKRVGLKNNRAFLEGILYGVCRGDAAFNSDQARCTVMMSRPMLIRDLYIVSLMLGLSPSLSKTGLRKDGRIYKAINFNGANFNAVAKLSVVPYVEWQSSKGAKTDRNLVGKHLISKITGIKRVDYDGYVYDLQVSGSHTYIANFVCVHNCQYCGCRPGTKELSLDHVLPRAQGGKTTWENVVVACTACNSKKADRTPEQAGMKLLRLPKRPTHNFYPGDVRVRDWEAFLGAAYWLTELENDEPKGR